MGLCVARMEWETLLFRCYRHNIISNIIYTWIWNGTLCCSHGIRFTGMFSSGMNIFETRLRFHIRNLGVSATGPAYACICVHVCACNVY